MSKRFLIAIALTVAAAAAPLSDAHAARPKNGGALAKGDLIVIFSGGGGGSYRYHEPADGSGAACRSADTSYSEADSYRWYYRFVPPPSSWRSARARPR